MQIKIHSPFSSTSGAIPLPYTFFSDALLKIDNLNELKLTLYSFFLIKRKRGYPRFTSINELLGHSLFISSMSGTENDKNKEELLKEALGFAVQRGTLLTANVSVNGKAEEAIFLNMEPEKTAYEKLVNGELDMTNITSKSDREFISEPMKDIYSLYEQNIGIITPIVAEELKKAEEDYPKEWMVEAFTEAAEMNKRNWRYVYRILERWATEGKFNGKTRGYIKKDKKKYTRR